MTTRPRALLVPVLCAAAALVQFGCASVDHINAYRGIRADFNEAARAHNARVLGDTFEAIDATDRSGNLGSRITAPQKAADLQSEADQWQDVYEQANALSQRSAAELKADDLYGAARTLEVVARARANVCRHLMASVASAEAAAQPPATAPARGGSTAEAVTRALAEAEAVLKDGSVRRFPRDRYMLQSLRPIVRYEIAGINARRALALGKNKEEAVLDPIAEDVAAADAEYGRLLSDPSNPIPADAVPHATLSRFIMLQAGATLVKGSEFLHRQGDPVMVPDRPGFRALATGVTNFRSNALKAGTPENALLQRIKGPQEGDEQALVRVGLPELQAPPNP